ncbi:MAG: hypothetical protein WA957_06230 [Alteraurantiacibacter sp.]
MAIVDTVCLTESLKELTSAVDGKPEPFNPDIFEEVSVGGRPSLIVKDLPWNPAEDDAKQETVEPIHNAAKVGASSWAEVQPVVMTITRGMYRTRYPGEPSELAYERPLVRFPDQPKGRFSNSSIEGNVQTVMVQVLDRVALFEAPPKQVGQKGRFDYQVDHFCTGYLDGGSEGCGALCEYLLRPGVNIIPAEGQAIGSDTASFFSVLFDWHSYVDADEVDMLTAAFGGITEAVDMIGAVIPNRSVVWTPLYQVDESTGKRKPRAECSDWLRKQGELIRNAGAATVYEGEGIQFLDGTDIFITTARQMNICKKD